jgi:hypothetical protein
VIQKLGPLLAALLLCTAAPVCSTGTGQTYGPVRPGETLWRIAGQAYPGARLDRDQVMLALLEANPDAVAPPCNVNGVLRVGAWLALPAPERVAGALVQALLPTGAASPNAYAVVGVGAMLAGTTHAPFRSILMIFEMTLDYEIVLPLMLAIVTAHYTAQRYTSVSPMYAESLLPREPTGEAQKF